VAVVDASVWVALNHADDPAHGRAVAWFEWVRARDEPLVAPTLLSSEVAGAMRRLTGQEGPALKVVDQLTTLGVIDLIVLDQQRARQAAELAAASGVRGADAVYLALAREREDVLVTFDRVQRDRGAAFVRVQEP
jgi:predicted nucleic acid-binding protein